MGLCPKKELAIELAALLAIHGQVTISIEHGIKVEVERNDASADGVIVAHGLRVEAGIIGDPGSKTNNLKFGVLVHVGSKDLSSSAALSIGSHISIIDLISVLDLLFTIGGFQASSQIHLVKLCLQLSLIDDVGCQQFQVVVHICRSGVGLQGNGDVMSISSILTDDCFSLGVAH